MEVYIKDENQKYVTKASCNLKHKFIYREMGMF